MSKVISKCPHCGKKLGKIDPDEYLYGSPLQVCPGCKSEYFDARYHEIAVDGMRETDVSLDGAFLSKKRKNGMWTILGGIGVMVLFIVMCIVGVVFYFFPIISILLIVNGIKTIKSTNKDGIEKRRQELAREAQRSQERMQDSEYVEKLRYYGYARTMPANEE